MSETRATYTPDDDRVYCDAIIRLGVDRLAQILTAVDDIRAETGYGCVEIVVHDGRVCKLAKRVDYE